MMGHVMATEAVTLPWDCAHVNLDGRETTVVPQVVQELQNVVVLIMVTALMEENVSVPMIGLESIVK